MSGGDTGPAGWAGTILPPDGLDAMVEPDRESFDPTRVAVEVVTVTGRAASVVFRIRRDTVEVWRSEHCCGVFDREALRAWLAEPVLPLISGEVQLTLDRAVDNRGGVAITLPTVQAWTLSPVELVKLQERM